MYEADKSVEVIVQNETILEFQEKVVVSNLENTTQYDFLIN